MANEPVLSQEEIDALLQGVAGGEVDRAAPPVAFDGLPAYDLGSLDRVVRSRMPTLEVIHDRFARHLRNSLFNFMRRVPDITVGPIQIRPYGDFVHNLPVPTNINMLHMKPLRGTALFVFDPNLVFLVVDNLFGSDGRYHMRVEGRDFTRTELRIIKRLLDLSLQSYGEAWAPVFPLDFDYVRTEIHGNLANIVAPNELVVNTTLKIEFGTVKGLLHVCIPYSMIEPIRDLLYNQIQDTFEIDHRWIKQLSNKIQNADVELTTDFVTVPSTIGDMLKLQVGDVLPIELPSSLIAKVDDVPVMECSFGISNQRYALRVQQMTHTQNNALENEHV